MTTLIITDEVPEISLPPQLGRTRCYLPSLNLWVDENQVTRVSEGYDLYHSEPGNEREHIEKYLRRGKRVPDFVTFEEAWSASEVTNYVATWYEVRL